MDFRLLNLSKIVIQGRETHEKIREMRSDKVYEAVRSFVSNHDYKLENVFVHSWEADLFSVTSSKYAYEIEVKVSRSDFFADFEKPKHHFFKTFANGYGIMRQKDFHEYNNSVFKGQCNLIESLPFNYSTAPNKFFYACPVGLVADHEVPKYAGLIYVMDSGEFRIIKKAPFLHKVEMNVKQMLFDKYFYKYIDQKFEITKLKHKIGVLKKALANPDKHHIEYLLSEDY